MAVVIRQPLAASRGIGPQVPGCETLFLMLGLRDQRQLPTWAHCRIDSEFPMLIVLWASSLPSLGVGGR